MGVPLYDYESYRIQEIIVEVQRKFFGKTASAENLNALSKEIKGRLEDFGFVAVVDVTPCLIDEPIEVRVESRVEFKPFDYEYKATEVRKSRLEGGI